MPCLAREEANVKLQTRLIAGLLLCSTLSLISGCVHDGYGRHGERYGDRYGDRRGEHYYSEQRTYCESEHRRDDRYFDCSEYDQRRDEYERRNR
jgi:hypothetical protein